MEASLVWYGHLCLRKQLGISYQKSRFFARTQLPGRSELKMTVDCKADEISLLPESASLVAACAFLFLCGQGHGALAAACRHARGLAILRRLPREISFCFSSPSSGYAPIMQ
jgi:hypothetical protein